jgi:hypothetical protein
MPLLEVQHIKKVTAAVQLEESVAVATDKYAAFIRASADDVINKAWSMSLRRIKTFRIFSRVMPAEILCQPRSV